VSTALNDLDDRDWVCPETRPRLPQRPPPRATPLARSLPRSVDSMPGLTVASLPTPAPTPVPVRPPRQKHGRHRAVPRWKRELRAWVAACREIRHGRVRWRRVLLGGLLTAMFLVLTIAAGVWDALWRPAPVWNPVPVVVEAPRHPAPSPAPASAATRTVRSKARAAPRTPVRTAVRPLAVAEPAVMVAPVAYVRHTTAAVRPHRTATRSVAHHYRHRHYHHRHHYRHVQPRRPAARHVAPRPAPRVVRAAPKPAPKPAPKAAPVRSSSPAPRPVVVPVAARLPAAPAAGSVSVRCGATALAGTQPWVSAAGRALMARFGIAEPNVLGRAGRAGASDHPSGLALDFMVRANTVLGNQLADYVVAHRAELHVSYVIYRQRINLGSGWKAMEDRGSPTANHMDHVHVSFNAGGC
jgi:hypothetical protein